MVLEQSALLSFQSRFYPIWVFYSLPSPFQFIWHKLFAHQVVGSQKLVDKKEEYTSLVLFQTWLIIISIRFNLLNDSCIWIWTILLFASTIVDEQIQFYQFNEIAMIVFLIPPNRPACRHRIKIPLFYRFQILATYFFFPCHLSSWSFFPRLSIQWWIRRWLTKMRHQII